MISSRFALRLAVTKLFVVGNETKAVDFARFGELLDGIFGDANDPPLETVALMANPPFGNQSVNEGLGEPETLGHFFHG
jgi:hypothetical protein